MARRFCGFIVINVKFVDASYDYRCSIGRWSCRVGSFAIIQDRKISVDSPAAYDDIARSAVSFALNDGVLDGNGLDMDEHGDWLISRKPPTVSTERR